ncbi:MAG: class I SAM-dependent methyltransferase [Nevskia sp.]
MSQRKTHWETVYTTKAAEDVSWFQAQATRSLAMIREAAPALDAAIVDVGGGASVLVDGLLDAGYRQLTVLDLSDAALAATRTRLGVRAAAVQWLAADITEVALPDAAYDVWHDRAVFHFLVEADARARYVGALRQALRLGGQAVIATFAEDGPERCSGLPVRRYSSAALAAELGAAFVLLDAQRETHETPGGGRQSFQYGRFLHRGD